MVSVTREVCTDSEMLVKDLLFQSYKRSKMTEVNAEEFVYEKVNASTNRLKNK